ncbi:hypothetical protein FKM82_023334 [Ascaphus truei]
MQVDCNNYVLKNSSHHTYWTSNITFGQFRRIRKNCSDQETYEVQASILEQRFKSQNYPTQEIVEAKRRARDLERSSILQTNSRKPVDNAFIQFITQFNRDYFKIQHILNKHWHF